MNVRRFLFVFPFRLWEMLSQSSLRMLHATELAISYRKPQECDSQHECECHGKQHDSKTQNRLTYFRNDISFVILVLKQSESPTKKARKVALKTSSFNNRNISPTLRQHYYKKSSFSIVDGRSSVQIRSSRHRDVHLIALRSEMHQSILF